MKSAHKLEVLSSWIVTSEFPTIKLNSPRLWLEESEQICNIYGPCLGLTNLIHIQDVGCN